MKSFYASERAPLPHLKIDPAVLHGDGPAPVRGPFWGARIAVYDTLSAAPRTLEVQEQSELDLIESISSQTYTAARDLGGNIPYTVIREVVENFIHADFREPVVSVLSGGETIRFADQGPGIADKEKAGLPGFTTASSAMKRFIRGVGSGLPIVGEYLAHSGGGIEIDDNLGSGTVVTISSRSSSQAGERAPSQPVSPPILDNGLTSSSADHEQECSQSFPPLSTRQKQVLSLVLELGAVGPTLVSKELGIALSTAHRDLAHLEQAGLISSDDSGKRVLSKDGSSYLDGLFFL